jgi:hypothetical protein
MKKISKMLVKFKLKMGLYYTCGTASNPVGQWTKTKSPATQKLELKYLVNPYLRANLRKLKPYKTLLYFLKWILNFQETRSFQ